MSGVEWSGAEWNGRPCLYRPLGARSDGVLTGAALFVRALATPPAAAAGVPEAPLLAVPGVECAHAFRTIRVNVLHTSEHVCLGTNSFSLCFFFFPLHQRVTCDQRL